MIRAAEIVQHLQALDAGTEDSVPGPASVVELEDGRRALLVELPDVYDDTPGRAARATRWKRGGGPAPRPVSGAVGDLFAAPRRFLPADVEVTDWGDHLRLARGRLRLRLGVDARGCLAVTTPHQPLGGPAAAERLQAYARRVNARLRLARLEVDERSLGLAVRLPADHLREDVRESLARALAMAVEAVCAAAAVLPELAVLADPGFQPLLDMVVSGEAARVPIVTQPLIKES